eukprot:superscaffoldBa00006000_g21019
MEVLVLEEEQEEQWMPSGCLVKSRVILMQICREHTEDRSTFDMDINLFLGSENIFLPYYGWSPEEWLRRQYGLTTHSPVALVYNVSYVPTWFGPQLELLLEWSVARYKAPPTVAQSTFSSGTIRTRSPGLRSDSAAAPSWYGGGVRCVVGGEDDARPGIGAVSCVGCSPRGKVTHTDGSGQMRIYTPSVISALQKHLASTDPELGGPLENLDVPPGGVSSHWESRLLQGSIMAAVLGDSTTVRIDLVTLAALQDTGWYAVNLSQAQSLVWGDGEGAMFGSVSTCQNNSSTFFCTGSGLGCHYLHLHKGECQTDQYLEKCRVYKPLKNGSECWKKENDRQSAEEDWGGEIFGFDSRCFFSSLNRQSHFLLSSSSAEGRCYRHRCTGPNRYQIQVSGSEWVDCPAGGSIQ